jgi:thiol oxidase
MEQSLLVEFHHKRSLYFSPGSQAHFRGYPCSVWTLFHALTVNAALKGDPAMIVGGRSTVAKTMVAYIHHFFSCRPCAENFAAKVNHLGFLPSTPHDSIMWLWQIHNMANQVLKGN